MSDIAKIRFSANIPSDIDPVKVWWKSSSVYGAIFPSALSPVAINLAINRQDGWWEKISAIKVELDRAWRKFYPNSGFFSPPSTDISMRCGCDGDSIAVDMIHARPSSFIELICPSASFSSVVLRIYGDGRLFVFFDGVIDLKWEELMTDTPIPKTLALRREWLEKWARKRWAKWMVGMEQDDRPRVEWDLIWLIEEEG